MVLLSGVCLFFLVGLALLDWQASWGVVLCRGLFGLLLTGFHYRHLFFTTAIEDRSSKMDSLEGILIDSMKSVLGNSLVYS